LRTGKLPFMTGGMGRTATVVALTVDDVAAVQQVRTRVLR